MRRSGAVVVSAFLCACGSVTIVNPADKAVLTASAATYPVIFKVTIGADRPTHHITLTQAGSNTVWDLVNGPNKLTRTDGVNAPDSYDGTVNLVPGDYRIDASGDNAGKFLSATSTFQIKANVTSPGLSFSPVGPIDVDVGATSSVTINRPASASGAITVSLSASPSGRVSLPANASFGATGTATNAFNITGQAVGTAQVSASASGYTSPPTLTVNVHQPTGMLLYRSHTAGVETYRFTPGTTGGSFQRVGSTASSLAPGLTVVGLDLKGTTLIRSGSQGFEAYTTGGTVAAPTLTLAGSAPSTGAGSPALTGSGTAAAVAQGAWVRGIGFGIETWQPGSGTLTRLGSSNTAGGATAGQALLAVSNYPLVLRSTPSSLEIWDLTSPSSPTRVANNISVFTAQTVPGIAWINPGRRLARSQANGVQIIDVDPTMSPPTIAVAGSNSTGGMPFGALAVANNGTLVARAVGPGLELYAVAPTGTATRCGSSNQGNGSAAGVALTSYGSWVFRTTPTSIEAYDLSGVTCPTANSTTALTLPAAIFTTGVSAATTGVGLAGPQ